MKNLLTLALALAIAAPTFAQDILVTSQGAAPQRSGSARVLGTAGSPDWFNKTINLDIRNATLSDAIKKVLGAAGVKLEKIDDQLGDEKATKNKVSLKLNDVNARDAMAAVTRLYGAMAYVLTEDGKTTIEIRKRVADPGATSLTDGMTTFRTNLSTFPSFGEATGFAPGSVFTTQNSERYKDLPKKRLDIEVKEGTALDVVKQVCEKAGLEYAIEDGIKSDVKVMLTMQGVSVGSALDNAAGWLGCGWKSEKNGEKIKILFGKKYPGPGFKWTIGPGGAGQRFTAPSATMPLLPDLPIVGNLFTRSATLPSKRVSLDKKNTDVRECFKEILKQANLSFALADDLPSDPKSFTFADISIATALDMICESIEVGWMAEKDGEGKVTVRVGKRYKGRSSRSTSPFLSELTRTTRSAEALRTRLLNVRPTTRPAVTTPWARRIPILLL